MPLVSCSRLSDAVHEEEGPGPTLSVRDLLATGRVPELGGSQDLSVNLWRLCCLPPHTALTYTRGKAIPATAP